MRGIIGENVLSFHTNFGDVVNRCEQCNGKGCINCNWIGWFVTWHKVPEVIGIADIPDVPMPYGKILPDLTNCEYINQGLDEDSYLDIIRCPNCNSDNVVILDKEYNPDIAAEQEILAERFFCISCQDSWCYEREH